MDGLIDRAARNVGLYAPDGSLVGYSRTVDAPDAFLVYLADVFVLPEHRGARPRRRARALHDRRGPYADAALDPAHRRRAQACTRSSASPRTSGVLERDRALGASASASRLRAARRPSRDAADRDALLRERVAVAHRDRVVRERLLVDRQPVGRPDLVLAAVAAADRAAVVVLDAEVPPQLLVERRAPSRPSPCPCRSAAARPPSRAPAAGAGASTVRSRSPTTSSS